MKVRCIDDLGLTKLEVGKIYEGELKFSEWWGQDRWYIKGMENLCFREHAFEIVKEDNMEKTFREVIADIKEGEVWVNDTAPISFIKLRPGGILDFNKNVGINLNVKYKLQRKEYTFEEAFKAYEEGKEIENILTGLKIKTSVREGWGMLPIINGKLEDDVFSKTLSIEEVRTKWYINN